MNVLVIAQYFPPDMGGGSTRTSNVVKGLIGKGCNVIIVTAFPHYPHGNVPECYKYKAIVSERFGKAKVYRVWIPALPHSSLTKRIIIHVCFVLSSLFASPFIGKVDVVWGANPNLFSFIPSSFYGIIKRVPVVRNVDDLWPEVFYEFGYVKSTYAKELLDFFAWLSYTIPKAITPISVGYKNIITSKYKINPEKIHVIEVGVETVGPLKQINLRSNKFIVMYSGVLGVGYNFDLLLNAAQLLQSQDSIVFIIRGNGELCGLIKKAINKLKLQNVILDTQILPKAELSNLLNQADVFVLPMVASGFVDQGLPTKVFEYQAYGKPIVCVSKGETARYVQASSSGIVVGREDAKSFADAILKLYQNKELASTLGKNGWTYVSSNMTAEKTGARMYSLLATVTSAKKNKRRRHD